KNLRDGIVACLVDTQGHVGFQLAIKPITQLAAGNKFTLAPGQRRGIHHEVHGQGGFVNTQERQSIQMIRRGEGATDTHGIESIDQYDVTRLCFVHLDMLEPLELQHLVDAPLEDRKSTRLNSSHVKISYAVVCLK